MKHYPFSTTRSVPLTLLALTNGLLLGACSGEALDLGRLKDHIRSGSDSPTPSTDAPVPSEDAYPGPIGGWARQLPSFEECEVERSQRPSVEELTTPGVSE